MNFKTFLKVNAIPAVLLTAAYILMLAVIGFSNVPYWEDAMRSLHGVTDWGVWDGRWGTEYLVRLLNAGRPIIYLGLTPFIFSALALALASLIVIYTLVGSRANWLTFFLALTIGLNPWSLNALAYRFDGSAISLSILLATATMLFFRTKPLVTVISIALLTFGILNFFQSYIGLTLILLLTVTLIDWLNGHEATSLVWRRLGYGLLGLLGGVGLYGVQLILINANRPPMFGLENLPAHFMRNLLVFGWTFYQDSATSWLFFAVSVVALAAWALGRQSVRGRFPTTLAILLYFMVVLPASGGILLLANAEFIGVHARLRYPLAFAIACFAIIASAMWLPKFPLKNSSGWLPKPVGVEKAQIIFRAIARLVLIGFAYLWLSVVFLFANAQSEQQSALEFQAQTIFADVFDTYRTGEIIVYDPNIFNNSIYLERLAQRFPIFDNRHPYVALLNTHSDNALWRLADLLGLYPMMDLLPMQARPGICDIRGEVTHTGPRWEVWRSEVPGHICVVFPSLAHSIVNTHMEQVLRLPLNQFPFPVGLRPNFDTLASADIEMAIWSLHNPGDIQIVNPVELENGVAIFVVPPPTNGWQGDTLVAHFFLYDAFLFQQIWELNERL